MKDVKWTSSEEWKKVNDFIWCICLFVTVFFMFVLVYRQAFSTGGYDSDIGTYINDTREIGEKELTYPVMFWGAYILDKFLYNTPLAMAIMVTIFNFLALQFTRNIIRKLVGDHTPLLVTFSSIALFFVSMIFNHRLEALGILHYYVGVGSPNPWHNATYMAARPFSILSFAYGAYTLAHYEADMAKGIRFEWGVHKYYIFFAFIIALTTLTKPSYTLPHMVVVFVVAVYRVIKNKFSTLRQSVLLAVAYIPTICVLIWQYFLSFTGTSYGEEQGIAISLFESWSMNCKNIPLAILLAALFPFITLVIHRDQLKESAEFRFAWQIYIVGLLMNVIFIEKGVRANDGNFGWGYLYGIFFVFLTGIVMWIRDIQTISNGTTLVKKKMATLVETMTLLLHLVMGIHYFQMLFIGMHY